MGKVSTPVIGVILLAATVLVGAGSAAAGEGADVPASIEVAPITASGLRGRPVVEGHGFGFSVDVSPCLGPNLTLDHATVVERPEDADHVKAAIVTAYLLHPAHREQEDCPKVRRIRFARVRTKRPAADLVFFDGISSPPRRIWPAVKSTPLRHHRSHGCGSAKDTTLLADKPRPYLLTARIEAAVRRTNRLRLPRLHRPFDQAEPSTQDCRLARRRDVWSLRSCCPLGGRCDDPVERT